jgi:lipopolysaccharide transport system ATP-binding protein
MTAQVITVDGVSKRYRVRAPGVARITRFRGASFEALRDVSFGVDAGEVVGVVGRNGAGKSTLLKILSRVTVPTSGRVTLVGRVGSLLEVGTGFHAELTGRENIFLSGALLGMSRRYVGTLLDEIVAFSGVATFLDVPVKRYSSGMYVRLAFSVAAHLAPEILLLDEVLAVGDAEYQQKCLRRIGELSRRDGRTVLFVSHNLAAIEQLCTRAIVLESGRLIADGPTAATLNTYLSSLGEVGYDAENEFDLSVADTTHGGAPHLATASVQGAAHTATIRSGDVVEVEIAAANVPAASDWSIAVGFSTATGVRVFTMTSRDAFAAPATAALGWLRTTFSIARLPLLPGEYFLDVGLFDHVAGEWIETVEAKLRVGIREGLDVPPHGAPGDGRWGVVWCDYAVESRAMPVEAP